MIRSHMTRHALLITLLSVALPAAASASEPAMVSKVGGKEVAWRSGDKTAAPRVQTLLAPGDRLVAGKGSFVEVEYLADRCTIRVKSGGSITIADVSPCAAAPQTADKAAPEAASAEPEARIIPAAVGAVEVSAKEGPVTRVNLGNGLVDASVGDALKVGDEVFAGANSSVTLYFAVPGCSYTVPAGSVYKVTSTPPCEAPAAAPDGSAALPPAGGVAPGVILAGGVAVAGVVAIVAVIAGSDDDNDGNSNNNPATPD